MASIPDLGRKPQLGYTGSVVSGAAGRRADESFLKASMADKRCGVFAVGGELVVMRKTANGADPLFAPDEARALASVNETVFLGLVAGAARFGIALAPYATKALKERSDLSVTD